MRGGHKCFICGGKMEPYFSKTFTSWGVGTFDYDVCRECGFAICQSLIDMQTDKWVELNERFHTEIYKHKGDPFNREGRLRGQADAIGRLIEGGLIPTSAPLVDWGSGVGDLALKMLERRHYMHSYDKFIRPLVNPYQGDPKPKSCSFVIAAAVFEHLRNRQEMDAIEELVAADGVLAIHMSIPKVIPKDPNWVYLLPVHCAFYTGESMRRLMHQWGYAASVYCRSADTWFLFKKAEGLPEKVAALNSRYGYDYLVYSSGFVDKSVTEHVEKPKSEQRFLYIGTRDLKLDASWTYRQWDAKDFTSCFKDSTRRFPKGTFDGVYSDLVMERLSPKDFAKYSGLVGSVLKPQGVHRIVTADLSLNLDKVAKGTWKEAPWVKKAGITTPAEYLNACFQNWGHKYLYDAPAAKKRLHETGHHNVAQHSFRNGRLPVLSAIDAEKHRLFLEAVC